MEDLLGAEKSDLGLQQGMARLVEIFNRAGKTKSKVTKSTELHYSPFLADITTPGSALQYVTRLLGHETHVYGHSQQEACTMDTRDETSANTRASRHLWSKLLYEAEVNFTLTYERFENSYIQLMKHGEECEQSELLAWKSKQPCAETNPDIEPRLVRDVKRLNFWENFMKGKMDKKLKEERLRGEGEPFNKASHPNKTTEATSAAEEVAIGTCNDEDKVSTTYSNEVMAIDTCDGEESFGSADTASATDESDETGSDEVTESDVDVKKEKKKGVVRKITAPLRWLRKRF